MLVVDDNETNRLIVSEMVSCWGIDAEEAVDAPSGLELAVQATEQGRPFDIIVLDHQMPGMDGFEFLEALRADERLAASAVIMLSSDPRGRNAAAARRLGLLDYLLKPVRRGELREAVSIAVAAGGSSPSGLEPPEPTESRPTVVADAEHAGEAPASRILLVEDTEDNRFLIRHYLDATTHVLVEAVDGKEGLEAVMDAAEPFDLVLMDMQMPVMDGYEATRRIRAWESEQGRDPVCVLALSAYAMEEESRGAWTPGAMDICPSRSRRGRFWLPSTRTRRRGCIMSAEYVAHVERSLEELVPVYLQRRANDVVAIREAIDAGDFETAKILGHSMKGSGGGYGFDDITEFGARIEQSAAEGDAGKTLEVVGLLEDYLGCVEIVIVEDE